MLPLKIDHHAGDDGIGAVLRGAHTAHAKCVYRDALRAVIAYRSWQIDQNSVGSYRRFNRWQNRSSERDFHSHLRALSSRRDALHNRWACRALCPRGRQHEHHGYELFLNCRHFFLTFVSLALVALHRNSLAPSARDEKLPRIRFYPPPCPLAWH